MEDGSADCCFSVVTTKSLIVRMFRPSTSAVTTRGSPTSSTHSEGNSCSTSPAGRSASIAWAKASLKASDLKKVTNACVCSSFRSIAYA